MEIVSEILVVQGSDPPWEQRGCSNPATRALYRFPEIAQRVTLLPLAGMVTVSKRAVAISPLRRRLPKQILRHCSAVRSARSAPLLVGSTPFTSRKVNHRSQ